MDHRESKVVRDLVLPQGRIEVRLRDQALPPQPLKHVEDYPIKPFLAHIEQVDLPPKGGLG
jgi:hypothetical protein